MLGASGWGLSMAHLVKRKDRGGVFYVRWVEQGRRRQESTGTDKSGLAKEVLERKRRELFDASRLGITPVERIRFRDLVETHWTPHIESARSPATVRTYRGALAHWITPALGSRVIADITRADVDRVVAAARWPSPTRRNTAVSALSSVLRLAVSLGYARENVALGLPRARTTERAVPYLAPEDQARLVECLPDEYRVAGWLALASGLRLGELQRLEWGDVELESGQVRVRKSKSGKPRAVYVTEAMVAGLREHGRGRVRPMRGPDLMFPGLRLSGASYRVWAQRRMVAGLIGFRFHDFRHMYAVNCVRAGVPLTDVKELLGHASIAQTMRYASHAPGDFRERARDLMAAAEVTMKEVTA